MCTHVHPHTHTPTHTPPHQYTHLRALIEVLLNFKLFSRRQPPLQSQSQSQLQSQRLILIPIQIPVSILFLFVLLLLLLAPFFYCLKFSLSAALFGFSLSHALLSLPDMFFECFIVDTNNVTQMSKRGHCFSCYCRRFPPYPLSYHALPPSLCCYCCYCCWCRCCFYKVLRFDTQLSESVRCVGKNVESVRATEWEHRK